MTDTTLNRAKEIKSKIEESEDEHRTIQRLYKKNKKEDLEEEEIEAIFQLASKGNTFINGVYNNDFRNL